MAWLKASRLLRHVRRTWSWLLGRPGPAEEGCDQGAVRFKVIHPDGALLRSEVDLKSSPVAMLPQGQIVQGLEERGRRARVRLSDGTQAWLSLYEADGTPIMRRLPADRGTIVQSTHVNPRPRPQSQEFKEEFERKWQRLRVDADGLEARPHRLRDGSMGIPILRWRPASQPQPNPSDLDDDDDWPLPELEPLDPPPKPVLSCQQQEEDTAEPEDLLDMNDSISATAEESDVFVTESRVPSLVAIFSTQDRIALDGLRVASIPKAPSTNPEFGSSAQGVASSSHEFAAPSTSPNPGSSVQGVASSNQELAAPSTLTQDLARSSHELAGSRLTQTPREADDAEQPHGVESGVLELGRVLGGAAKWDSRTLDRVRVEESAPCRWNTASSVNTSNDPWATAELRMKSDEGFSTAFRYLESIADAPGDNPAANSVAETPALDAPQDAEFDGEAAEFDGDGEGAAVFDGDGEEAADFDGDGEEADGATVDEPKDAAPTSAEEGDDPTSECDTCASGRPGLPLEGTASVDEGAAAGGEQGARALEERLALECAALMQSSAASPVPEEQPGPEESADAADAGAGVADAPGSAIMNGEINEAPEAALDVMGVFDAPAPVPYRRPHPRRWSSRAFDERASDQEANGAEDDAWFT